MYWKAKKKIIGSIVRCSGLSYKNYDKRKIKAIYNELNPDWKKLKISKVKDLKFKKPDGGSDVETRS